jgi:hypothetical protein
VSRVEARPPGAPAPGTPRGIVEGGGAPAPWTRETVFEAEAAHSRVAAEAEAGEMRVHALPESRIGSGGEGIRKHACLWGKGEVRRGNASDK